MPKELARSVDEHLAALEKHLVGPQQETLRSLVQSNASSTAGSDGLESRWLKEHARSMPRVSSPSGGGS